MTRSAMAISEVIGQELSGFAGVGFVYAKNLTTSEEIDVRGREETATASTIKVPILIELFRQVEAGEHNLAERLIVTDEVRTRGSGVLRDLSPGIELSVRDVAVLMIVVSDNIATNMLIDLCGIDRINATMQACGFRSTRLVQRLDFPKIGADARDLAVTTPRDLAGIMAALALGSILSPASCAEILDIMRMQHQRDLIPRYLPFTPHAAEIGEPDNGLRIANKTGGWRGLRADMALVEWPQQRYVAAIVTEKDPDTRFWAENAADRLIGRVSRIIFEHWGGRALELS